MRTTIRKHTIQCGWARYNVEFLFRNFLFPFLCILGSGGFIFILPALMIYCFSSLLCVLESAELESGARRKQEWNFSSFAKKKRRTFVESLLCMWRRMMTARRTWSEEDSGLPFFCVHLIYLLLLYLWMPLVINFRVINHAKSLFFLTEPRPGARSRVCLMAGWVLRVGTGNNVVRHVNISP